MADTGKRKQNPTLAIIVISLLVVMALIAFVDGDGSRRSPDAGVNMPVDRGGDGAVMPQPNPGAPVPARRAPANEGGS